MKNPDKKSSIRKKLLLVLLGVSLVLGIFMSCKIFETIDSMFFFQRVNNAYEFVDAAHLVLFNSRLGSLSSVLQMEQPSDEYERVEMIFYTELIQTKVDRLTIYRPEPDGTQTLLFDIDYKSMREREDHQIMEFVAGKNVSIYDSDEIILDVYGEEVTTDVLGDDNFTYGLSSHGYSPGRFSNPRLYEYDNYIFASRKISDVIIKAISYRSTYEDSIWSGISILLKSTWAALAVVTLIVVIVAQWKIARPIKRLTVNVTSYKHGDGSRIFFEAVKTNDEIEVLSGAFGKMIDDIEAYIQKVEELCETYYKFVPVQFLKYLGKQEIIDVELGDAQSMNFAVLFCDIRGFSEKSEHMSAVENFGFVNHVFGVAGPIIRKYDGFIDKYIGDSVMALFPDVAQSVSAGIELYNTLVLNDDTGIKFEGEPINVGVGIHTGTTMIGIVGEHMRLSGTVISDTVNLASRLEGITKYYKTGMIISSDVVEKLPGSAYEIRCLGTVKAAGLTISCEIYEALECLPPDEKQKRLETKAIFERSLRDFHAGNVAEASSGLAEVIASDPGDAAARMYAEYIASQECVSHSYISFSEK